jgi:hypothetical protein
VITAAIHGLAVAPAHKAIALPGMAALASEVSERIGEMNAMREGAGTDFVLRLATMARIDRGALDIVLAVLHGNTSVLTDSYSERAETCGRRKQTMHYRTLKHIDSIRIVFPEVAAQLDCIRESVTHHEDPLSHDQLIRDGRDD